MHFLAAVTGTKNHMYHKFRFSSTSVSMLLLPSNIIQNIIVDYDFQTSDIWNMDNFGTSETPLSKIGQIRSTALSSNIEQVISQRSPQQHYLLSKFLKELRKYYTLMQIDDLIGRQVLERTEKILSVDANR